LDWYLDGSDVTATVALRQEIRGYLERHGDPSSDLDAAEVAAAEVLSNLWRHAPGPAWVSLTWTGEHPLLEVRDLGPGFEPDVTEVPPVHRTGGRGLFLVSAFTKSFETAAREAGGTTVSLVLDVHRRAAASYDPEPSIGPLLPGLDEARPEGGFDRESFLRALVVQLAQAVERTGGPALAEASVAQVAIDVGSQMEAEYRAAAAVTDRLDPERLAECFVRLKHAIDGGFFVIEITPDRIVLGNTHCPFGDAVRAAPALCRMTSAVFGGIAANSHGEASVVLEERIAVGDPGCRVVIELGPVDSVSPAAHRYRAHRPVDVTST
jgi:predicted ArsR family transcriptional regulator/anti-sigma regulatory factor (Ser/Thr protein kinase)